jgi:hypothetical protein
MSIHESIQQLKPNLFWKTFGQNEYDDLMHVFDRLMRENLDEANKEKLTEFINDGIDKIYIRFDNDTPIHPETLNILIRAIQVYNHNHAQPYSFTIYENEDPNDPTVMFMNHIVRRAAQREKLFDRTRGAYTKTQLEEQRVASKTKETNMHEVDGGAKRKRTKRRHKRKQRKQRKSKRVKRCAGA